MSRPAGAMMPNSARWPRNALDQHGPLPDQQIARPMMQQGRLLGDRLDRHEAHVRPADRFADRLGISGIGLAAADIRLDIGWRDQPNLMPGGLEKSSPIMRSGTRFDANQAARQRFEEGDHLGALQLAPNGDLSHGVDAVHLNTRLARSRPIVLTSMTDGSSSVASPNDDHVRHSMPFSRGRPPHQLHGGHRRFRKSGGAHTRCRRCAKVKS